METIFQRICGGPLSLFLNEFSHSGPLPVKWVDQNFLKSINFRESGSFARCFSDLCELTRYCFSGGSPEKRIGVPTINSMRSVFQGHVNDLSGLYQMKWSGECGDSPLHRQYSCGLRRNRRLAKGQIPRLRIDRARFLRSGKAHRSVHQSAAKGLRAVPRRASHRHVRHSAA